MLRSLKSQRTKLHGKIIEELSKAEELVGQTPTDLASRQLQKSKVDVSTSVLRAMQERFDSLSEKIMESSPDIDDESFDKESEFVTEVSTAVIQMQAKLTAGLGSTRQIGPAGTASASSPTDLESIQLKIDKLVELQSLQHTVPDMSSSILSELVPSHPSHAIRLPKLQFDKFFGDVLKFQEFWDSFDAAVHSNRILRPVEKLNYLRSYLDGEAKRVISGVATCDANYEVAVELIKERFGNPQASIDAHYSSITNLPAVGNHTPRIRQLFDQIEKHLRCLSALGEDVEHRHFISLIMSKLPKEMIIHLEQSKECSTTWTVELLRQKVQNSLSAREAAERQQFGATSRSSAIPNKPSSTAHSSAHSWYRSAPSHRSTAESLMASERRVRSSSKNCVFCKGSHFNDQCQKVRTATEHRRRLNGHCFICPRTDHMAFQCQSTKPCFHCKKVKKHNRCLCPVKFGSNSEASAVTAESDDTQQSERNSQSISSQTSESTDVSVLASGDKVLLQTAMVEVQNCNSPAQVRTRVLLDCASNRSYITAELAKKMQLQPKYSECFSVVTFGADKPKSVQTSAAQIKLVLKNGTSKKLDVSIVPKITGTIHRSAVPFSQSSFLWKNLRLADKFPTHPESSPIEFLIGNDYYLDLVSSEKIEISNGLYLLGSKLGWLLSGRIEGVKSSDPDCTMFVNSLVNGSIPQLCNLSAVDPSLPVKPSFEDFWNLESIGINDKPEVTEDEKAVASFNSSLSYNGSRYSVSWPWKDEVPDLPDNYQLAYRRFQSLRKKFREDKDLLRKYSEIISDQEKKGIIEKVTSTVVEGQLKHYIPHHSVVNPNKATTKVRIVYDASAKIRKDLKSLNECLYRGPIILQDLCGLLMRFRLNKVALISDIEKAFLQIEIHPTDRDVTRFFWLGDHKEALDGSSLQIYRFCRVPFGIISSPFLLSATIRHHMSRIDSPIAQQLSDNIYVDNVVTGVDTVQEAMEFYKQAKSMFDKASMNLREWGSNESQFMEFVPESDKVKGAKVKVLGIVWNIIDDSLSLPPVSSVTVETASTKRQMLQFLASVFDPLGFFAPLTIRGKLHLKKLWKEKLDWDQPVSKGSKEAWELISNELRKVSVMQIPRFVGFPDDDPVAASLLCFCDASADAYCAVIYLRIETTSGNISNIVFAKSRLAPSKSITIPRMELLATVIGARSVRFVERQLRIPISKKILWSDSQCVLHWLASKKPLTTFVQNRVREIKKIPDISFRYVEGQQNPADIATRDKFTMESLVKSCWWHGPLWILQPEDKWPTWPYDLISDHREEEKPSDDRSFEESGFVTVEDGTRPPFDIDIRSFSSLLKLFRVTAWASRFIERIRHKDNHKEELTSTEVSEAKLKWELYMQFQYFPEILSAFKSKKNCNIKDKLNIQQDSSGLLRCHGRFMNACLPETVKFPKLLPNTSHYTDLVILQAHRKLLHSGVNHTLSQLRTEYWILRGRSAVRRVLSSCRICRRHQGGPFRVPLMPPLPASRVNPSPAFTNTGLDYMGPLYVKTNGPEMSKAWICLFTCMSVRAVHLEVVYSLSAHHFIMCLRRFIARRGTPKQIVSDNASQFKLSSDVLKRLWGQVISEPEVHSFASSNGIQWRFIVERAPWMGGFYERLVGTVKNALKKSIGRLRLSPDQLLTCVVEVEAVLNSRPLIYTGDDLQQKSVITPAHFLSLNPTVIVPGIPIDVKEPDYQPRSDSITQLLLSWKKGHRLLNSFWDIWRSDYLSSLRERASYRLRQGKVISSPPPSVGDVVLVKEDNLARGSWKTAIIDNLLPSADGEFRAAQLRFPSGTVLNRPIKNLYPLECRSHRSSDDFDNFREATAPEPPSVFDVSPSSSSNKGLSDKFQASSIKPTKYTNTDEDVLQPVSVQSANKRPRRAAALKAKMELEQLARESAI